MGRQAPASPGATNTKSFQSPSVCALVSYAVRDHLCGAGAIIPVRSRNRKNGVAGICLIPYLFPLGNDS